MTNIDQQNELFNCEYKKSLHEYEEGFSRALLFIKCINNEISIGNAEYIT